ncbi:MAG: histidine kinase [Oscillospiraceae bacterium]|nr:histidine kinase [Oscillospiraceae bacterium]
MKSKKQRRRFALIVAAFTFASLGLWFIYHNTVFSYISQNAAANTALIKNSLLSELDGEFSRMKITSSVLAGSVYVQEFLTERDISEYYEKAGAVSEIILKTTYPSMNADSIITITSDGAYYRFTGGISNAAIERLAGSTARNGATVYSVTELDGTSYFCLITPVNPRGGGASSPAGHIVMLSNLAKIRRTLVQLDSLYGDIDAAVILNDVVLLSSNPALDGLDASELERLYGTVTVSQVTGTNLFAAALLTNDALYYGQRLFVFISSAMLIFMLACVAGLYGILSGKVIGPMLENTEIMERNLLKTQIDAHFLVNTINWIKGLSEQGKNEKAARAAENLGEMLKSLQESDEETNVFEQLEYLDRYIEIMNIRCDGKYITDIDVDNILCEYNMLGQILQPLAENALTHGLGSKQSDCRLTVSGRLEENHIILEVSDNGKGMPEETVRALQEHLDFADKWDNYEEYNTLKGVALVNIQKRIRNKYGRKYGLTIGGSPDAGLTVTVKLPAIEYKAGV